MYNYARNNYHKNPKPSNVQTPPKVSRFIFELLKDKFSIKKGYPILDPCCGQGSLLEPWLKKGYPTYGIDIESNSSAGLVQNFLEWDGIDVFQYKVKPQLILCNPPFNGYGNKLGSEVWLDKIIELFGKEVPIVLFAPAGFFGNLTLTSKRKMKFEEEIYPPISSIISLPVDIFEGVKFHSQILIFNVKGLKAHYFYKELETKSAIEKK